VGRVWCGCVVEGNDGICCSQWDPAVSERLLFDPYSVVNRVLAAHYFLLVASVTETVLIGRAENARVLMIDLHRGLGERLFTLTNPQLFNEAVRRSRFYRDYGPEVRRIGAVLAGVNEWVRDEAGGDLVAYSGIRVAGRVCVSTSGDSQDGWQVP